MSGSTEILSSAKFRGGFSGNWMAGASESRSLRRRLMAVLRLAHRVLGVRRKKYGARPVGGWRLHPFESFLIGRPGICARRHERASRTRSACRSSLCK